MIRQAKPENSRALCILLRQLGYKSELAIIEQNLVRDNNSNSSAVYVYDLSGEIVGFISIIQFFYFPTMQNIMRVTALCVHEQHRDLGIGSKLLSFVESLAVSSGIFSVEITCSIHREQTHQFYEKNGYLKHSYKFVKHLQM